MARRKCLKSVARNFLETYTCRYSEYEGYWLFGMCVDKIDRENIDLLNPNTNSSDTGPMEFARQLAASQFKAQMEKEGLAVACLRAASLEIEKIKPSKTIEISGHSRVGHDLRFSLTLLSDRNKKYQCIKTMFVAPHDAQFENASCREKVAMKWEQHERVIRPGPIFLSLLVLGFGLNTAVISEFWKNIMSFWLVLAIVAPPLVALVLFQANDLPNRFVKVSHLIAAIWQIVLTIGLLICFFIVGKFSRGWQIYPVLAILGLIPWVLVLTRLLRRQYMVRLTMTNKNGKETILCWKQRDNNI